MNTRKGRGRHALTADSTVAGTRGDVVAKSIGNSVVEILAGVSQL